jgi:hypothetical protein
VPPADERRRPNYIGAVIALAALELAGAPEPWAALGFATGEGEIALGSVSLAFPGAPGAGIRGWTLAGGPTGPASIDGLATAWARGAARPAASRHPNGAVGLDHVVVTTGDAARTDAALARAGLVRRRRRRAGDHVQSFYRLGEAILEVVGPATPAGDAGRPAAFWGLVPVVEDLDALAERLGALLRPPRDAVQPGRRIATVRPEAGLGVAVAFMTP